MFALLLSALGWGCTDDFDYRAGGYAEGDATVEATLSFTPFTSVSPGSRATMAPPGDGMKEITDFAILVYDGQGKLVKMFDPDDSSAEGTVSDLNITVVDRTDEDADPNFTMPGDTGYKPTTTEPKTGQATFKWNIGLWGNFYIYVAANMGHWENDKRVTTTYQVLSGSEYSESIQTVEGLKKIQLSWDSENYRNNREMLGFMTEDTGHHGNAPLISIGRNASKLHAWLKRAASKVTIDYDGTGMRDGVTVYLKQAVIRNIPKACYLGEKNTPKDTTETLYATHTFREKPDLEKHPYGHHIDYFSAGAEDNYENWLIIGNGTKSPDQSAFVGTESPHDNSAKALFFYENCQGNFEEDNNKEKYDKRQYPAEDGTVKDYKDMRDNVPAGTYIEVEGYYKNSNPTEASSGRIIYRFMLGKDIKYDFDAERNTHYKVTLKFKGNANDFDWHIDYKEEEGFKSPNPYYISYLYDEGMTLPVRYTGDLTGKNIHAEIIQNDWFPRDAKGQGIYYEGTVTGDGVWNGFLSLKKTTHADIGNDKTDQTTPTYYQYNEQYWKGNGDATKNEKVSPRGERDYDMSAENYGKPQGDATDGYYTTNYIENTKTYTLSVPLYTRAKTLVSRSSFTGNNPYVAYRRYAKVRFTITDKDGKRIGNDQMDVDIIQVTRVENPKAIYRSGGCDNPFDVTLTKLESESNPNYVEITSDGTWSAKIEYGDWFDLEKTTSSYSYVSTDSIKGKNGSKIQFRFRPKGTTADDNPRNGIILVRYHNETCIHRIFVRQGYGPLQITSGGPKIHTFNLVTKDTETSNPLDEGSLFRFGEKALDYPIDACENVADGFLDHSKTKLKIAGSDQKTAWEDIPTADQKYIYEKFTLKDGKGSGRLLKAEDIDGMKTKSEIGYGFGVVYGDESTTTAMNVADAYEWRRSNNSNNGKGMRCLVLYNKDDGRNTIFPIGASGYGRRKYGHYYPDEKLRYTTEFKEFKWSNYPSFRSGVVRYAHRSLPMTDDLVYGNTQYRPLFWDLYRRPGANYWLNQYVGSNGAFDINYFTFDTGKGDSNHEKEKDQSDALFMRLVNDP